MAIKIMARDVEEETKEAVVKIPEIMEVNQWVSEMEIKINLTLHHSI